MIGDLFLVAGIDLEVLGDVSMIGCQSTRVALRPSDFE